jgi:hypothetical protein
MNEKLEETMEPISTWKTENVIIYLFYFPHVTPFSVTYKQVKNRM